jgi:hypothetical protein
VSITARYGLRGPKYPVPDGEHLIVAVDLGKHKLGVAIGTPEKLLYAGTVFHKGPPGEVAQEVRERVKREEWLVSPYADGHPLIWVCEWPMKYPTKRKFHKDLEALHDVGRAIGEWDEKYLPGEWKGNVTKQAHHNRIWRALTPEELAVMPSPGEHDAWDAAGIYLFAAGRTRRGGVK